MPGRADRPDIEMGVAVKAKTLRLHHVPETDVRYMGDSETATDRRNLPEAVEAGVTYHAVEVRWHAQARVSARQLDDELDVRRERPR